MVLMMVSAIIFNQSPKRLRRGVAEDGPREGEFGWGLGTAMPRTVGANEFDQSIPTAAQQFMCTDDIR
jgi:hypothetical protein